MKIFILEDDPARIDAFELALKVFNGGVHEVTICKWLSGADGAFERFKPPYDLILLDHDLGGLQYVDSDGIEETGYKFVQWLGAYKETPDTFAPAIIIHSYNPDGARNMGLLLFQNGYTSIAEPFGGRLLKYLQEL